MELPDDFVPLVDSGATEPARGLAARIKQRGEIPQEEPGSKLVLVDEQGKASLSAGQRYWARGHSWVKVDVREHALAYEIPYADPTGRAGFGAHVTITAQVTDSALAASAGAESAKRFLEPALHEHVVRRCGTVRPVDGADPVVALNQLRAAIEQALRELVGRPVPDLPAWLAGTVSSVRVQFDAATRQHLDDLVSRTRTGERERVDGVNRQQTTQLEIERRELWRKHLAKHLDNRMTRNFEVVFSDPSPENIARVVAQVNEAERAEREEIITVLNLVRDQVPMDANDDVATVIKTIATALHARTASGELAALSGGGSPGALEAGSGDVVEGSTADPDDSGADAR